MNHEINDLTPLMAAAKMGRFNCAKALLWVGASILPKDADGSTAPWILACEENHKMLGDYLKQAYDEFCLTGMCRDHCSYREWYRREEGSCSGRWGVDTISHGEEMRVKLCMFTGTITPKSSLSTSLTLVALVETRCTNNC